MPEYALEEVIHERAFASLLESRFTSFALLLKSLRQADETEWSKKHFYPLVSEAEALESFLDDYGARYNRTYSPLRELVASVRWFGLAGFSLGHLTGRFEGYRLDVSLTPDEREEVRRSFESTGGFIRAATLRLLEETHREAVRLGIQPADDGSPETDFDGGFTKQRLPRNVGQEDIADEEQRIAEAASKYLAACAMFAGLGIHRLRATGEREQLLRRVCTEEQARVYEATVHNLQSTYDTHIKNTVLEGDDDRLPCMRGHLSAALHLLEAVTFLTHFVERHDSGARNEDAEIKIASLIDRVAVQDVILNHLLYWADQFMQRGRPIAEAILRDYTNLQELVVELPEDLKLHARPAALIVGIVHRYQTPVELEVDGRKCNAGSILDVLVTVGSHPDARRYVFRGDENPLRDIGLLFEHGLGEAGIASLPDELDYLRGD